MPADHPVWGKYDRGAEMKRLQGTWSVRANVGKDRDTWTIDGDKVTMKKSDGKTETGEIFMPSAGYLAVKTGDMISYHAYTRNGDDMYIGMGTSGVKFGDKYLVRANRGMVVFDGKTCMHHKEKMSFGKKEKTFEAPKPVKCELKTEGDKTVLHYQVPKFMKEDVLEASRST